MSLQSICCSLSFPKLKLPRFGNTVGSTAVVGADRRIRLPKMPNSYRNCNLKWEVNLYQFPKVKKVPRSYALHSDSNATDLEVSLESTGSVSDINSDSDTTNLEVSLESTGSVSDINADSQPNLGISPMGNATVTGRKFSGIEPFGGKSGSVSFYGVTHHVVEESKLVSSPFKDDGGSVLWVLAPLVFILSLVLPPIFVSNALDSVFKNEYLAEIASTLTCEVAFYAGIAIFLLITNRVQRPYLQFSAKRWGLITGLKGHLSTSFFAMGLKVVAPLVVTYVTWPTLGMQALVAVSPLLAGYLAQLALESFIDKQGSSCWPLVPIIFEVYRFYQLTRSVSYVESLMFAMSGALVTPEVTERSRALAAMSATFYVVALVCLWSLLTFLLRLFPSRPVSEKY